MNLSNLKPKYTKCLGPSSVSQSLTDNSCHLQLWLQNRFKSENNDSIFLERYKLQHTSALNNLISYLGKRHPEAKIDSEIQLPVVEFYGVSFFGIVDCLLTFPDGSVAIYDAKTGSRKSSHWLQIAIYYLMLKAVARSKGKQLPKLSCLGLFYADGKLPLDDEMMEKSILELKGDSVIDEIFLEGTKKKLIEILKVTSQNNLPNSTPSLNNCKYCKFQNYCPNALKDEGPIFANDLL